MSTTLKNLIAILIAATFVVSAGNSFAGPPKPDLPKPELPKPKVPKPDLPNPDLPDPKLPKPPTPGSDKGDRPWWDPLGLFDDDD